MYLDVSVKNFITQVSGILTYESHALIAIHPNTEQDLS